MMKNNIKNDKYTYRDASGTIQEYHVGNHISIENLGIKDIGIKDDSNKITISTEHNIIIDADSVTFRVGEFELKINNDVLMDELKHTDKIKINGISFIKED